MTRPVPAQSRKSNNSKTPTVHRSAVPMPRPEAPPSLGPIGAMVWAEVWTAGAGVYQPSDSYVIERYSSMMERRRHLLDLVEADGWLSTGSTGQTVVHPAAKMVGDLETRLSSLEDRLGLNPESRLRLGITASSLQTKLDAFLSEGGDA
tara:strand:+ start:134 stop:580 length:447 start_codon:yes stop_codon:yes gene_type:complete